MKIEEIISSLRDQIDDRESLIPPDDPESIFRHDAEALREAIKIIERVEEIAETERDAAIRDLESILFHGGKNIDTCNYCVTEDCYARGGHRLCDPKWRGRKKMEGKTVENDFYSTEQAIREEAKRLRNMTDKQLVEEFHRAADTELYARGPSVAQDGAGADGDTGDTPAVERLLTALAEGKCRGIKSGLSYRIAVLAEEMGLI